MLSDTELDALLRQPEPPMSLPPTFQAEVWRRIAVAEESSVASKLGRRLEPLIGWAAKPLGAAALCLAMVGGGIWLGRVSTGERNTGRLAYLESVSPFVAANNSER